MDTFMCSSWYFLRYASPEHDVAALDRDKARYWLPVDQYTGGAEHATMHLLYARFFIKALHDLGLVDFDEPFTRLFNQGVIIWQRQKMSKSRGNVVTPDDYVAEVGADAVRAYLMFVGPWEQGGEWNEQGINGMARWFNRVWNLALAGHNGPASPEGGEGDGVRELRRITHKTIKRVTEDADRFHFNTMLSSLMEFTNYLTKAQQAPSVTGPAWREAVDTLLLLLAPTAPHLAEELWTRTGHAYSIHNQPWPGWDEALAADEEITLVIQVNGKLRGRVSVPASITEGEARELALGQERVQAHIRGKEITRVIYVPGRLVNVVAR